MAPRADSNRRDLLERANPGALINAGPALKTLYSLAIQRSRRQTLDEAANRHGRMPINNAVAGLAWMMAHRAHRVPG